MAKLSELRKGDRFFIGDELDEYRANEDAARGFDDEDPPNFGWELSARMPNGLPRVIRHLDKDEPNPEIHIKK